MELNIETLKQETGELRTKDVALKVLEILSEMFSDSEIEINKSYYVSEWSWVPISDGNFPYQQKINYKTNINGIDIFATGTSCRTYFAWDLFDTEEDCRKMCKFKNSFGYDWERALSDFRKSKGIHWDFTNIFNKSLK